VGSCASTRPKDTEEDKGKIKGAAKGGQNMLESQKQGVAFLHKNRQKETNRLSLLFFDRAAYKLYNMLSPADHI
jgi:hypothetical protein